MKYMVTYSYRDVLGNKKYHSDIVTGLEGVIEFVSSIKAALCYELVSVTMV